MGGVVRRWWLPEGGVCRPLIDCWLQCDVAGQKEGEENYKDGKLDGLWLMVHDNGQKWSEGNYTDGKMDGLFLVWHENGQTKGEVTFKDDKLVEGSGKWWNSKGEPVDSR